MALAATGPGWMKTGALALLTASRRGAACSAAVGLASRLAGRQRPAAPLAIAWATMLTCSLHRQRRGGGGPPAEVVGQGLGGLLPGGDGGQGVAVRKPLDAHGAGEGDDRPVGVQAGDAGVRIVVARVHLEGGLPREIHAPGGAPPPRLGRRRPALENAQHALGPEVLMHVDGVHGRDHSLFCTKLVGFMGFDLGSCALSGHLTPGARPGARKRVELACAGLLTPPPATRARGEKLTHKEGEAPEPGSLASPPLRGPMPPRRPRPALPDRSRRRAPSPRGGARARRAQPPRLARSRGASASTTTAARSDRRFSCSRASARRGTWWAWPRCCPPCSGWRATRCGRPSARTSPSSRATAGWGRRCPSSGRRSSWWPRRDWPVPTAARIRSRSRSSSGWGSRASASSRAT